MTKKFKTMFPLAVAAVLGVAGLSGCSNATDTSGYTYHDAIENSPERWNPHTWQTASDSIIMDYTQMGFYDFILNDAKDGYTCVPEMADGELVDDTANLTDDEVDKYGLGKDKANNDALFTSGQKWVMNLNKNACWEDGTAIKADDYIYSMQQQLNPSMQNYRASSYTTGNFALGNADNYLKSGTTVYEWFGGNVNPNRTGTSYYFGLYNTSYGTNIFQKSAYDGYTLGYIGSSMDQKGSDDEKKIYATLIKMAKDTATYGTSDKPIWVEITDANKAEIAEAYSEFLYFFYGEATAVGEDETQPGNNAWNIGDFDYVQAKYPTTAWDNVGLVKSGDYQLTMYLVNPVTLFQAHSNLTGNWVVPQTLYESCKKVVGSLTSSTYGTSKETYMSYGPYKLSTWQLDKEFTVSKNDKWYGYTDGKHTNQYQITAVDYQVVSSDSMLQLFQQGKLDSYALRSQDVAATVLGQSTRLMYTPQNYTTKLTVNSDRASLATEGADGKSNHTILAQQDFRQALSLGMDRQTLAATQTAGSAGYDVPINSMYVSNEDTGELYRDTDQGKWVVTNNFGKDSQGNPNYYGYDLTEARKLIDKAVDAEQALYDGGDTSAYHKNGPDVVLNWEVYNSGWDTMVTWIVDWLTNIVKGTKLEGHFSVKTSYSTTYSDDLQAGSCDMGMSTWGGAAFDPYSIPECYISPTYKYERGINPDTKLTLSTSDVTTNGTSSVANPVTHTLTDWYTNLQSGEFDATHDHAVRLNVLAGLENYLVGTYNFISLYARQSVSLDSFRITEGVDHYLQMVGFGGIRFMKMTKTDKAWESYVSDKGGTLDYNK